MIDPVEEAGKLQHEREANEALRREVLALLKENRELRIELARLTEGEPQLFREGSLPGQANPTPEPGP